MVEFILKVLKAPLRLHNPMALTALALVAAARGGGYLLTPLAPKWLDSTTAGPGIPWLPVWVAGAVWLAAGGVLLMALFKRSLLTLSLSLLCGLYLTWAIIYISDIFVTPDTASIISLVSYVAMIPIILTLGQVEILKDAELAAASRRYY
ncbi:membrane protein [Corynebacterium phage EmiRose]|uniref:Membrane protein n=1 Tax=Corynebacterium phage EmiRose TaxID=2565372 RepID=A0A649VRF6_9CAUD|nr:membrane protein [Corynebacterium phage EmiRose]QGJ94153.1 membrane protein [Corynebacterium phage EmiRose]